jgi:hypothetical protein
MCSIETRAGPCQPGFAQASGRMDALKPLFGKLSYIFLNYEKFPKNGI